VRSALFLLGAIVALDQATKAWVESSSFAPRTIVPGYFDLVRAHNEGVAFSLFSDLPQGAIVAVQLAILTGVLVWLGRSKRRAEQLALAAIAAGAIGNLIDRIRLGYVIDFIDWHIGRWHWPAFNIADSAITIGALALLWLEWVRPR